MIASSLRALLANSIDYAGLFPPAALPLPEVIANYRRYLVSPDAWLLNRLVLPLGLLPGVELRENWRVTLLVDSEPGPLPHGIETLETRAPGRLSLPTYCEVPLDRMETGYAKIRTTGLSSGHMANFLLGAAGRRLPFKATAGLHHALRSGMHGFLNVFAAAVFAWQGADRAALLTLLDETDPQSFEFQDDGLRWRGRRVSTAQIEEARREFAHSFGSCSFEEPVSELRALGLIE